MVIVKEPTIEDYDDMLDDIYGEVNIAGSDRATSFVLKEIDPIMYEIGFDEYVENNTQYECEECGCDYEEQQDAEECCEDE